MMIPVRITGILVDKHIVDEGTNIQERIQLLIILVISSLGCRLRHQLPCFHVTFSGFDMVTAVLLNLDNVDITLLASQMILAILVVHTLGNIIQAPVHTIQEQMHIKGIHTGMSHLALHTTCPHITGVLGFRTVTLTPMLPRIPKVTAQHQLVEFCRLVLTEQRITQ